MKNALTRAECTRLDEVVFCFFITELYRTTINSMRIYDLVELLCDLSGASYIRLQAVISTIAIGDRRVMPSRRELVLLYRKAGYSVRDTCRMTKLSMRDYYAIVRGDNTDLTFQPKFEPTQSIEITKFLNGVSSVLPERTWSND